MPVCQAKRDADPVGREAVVACEDEGSLVERARTDAEAFGALYHRYYDRILNYAYRCTLDASAAEEITSNTFCSALACLARLRDGASFQAWLYRIATNEVRMHWRGRRSRQRQALQWRHDLARIQFDRQAAAAAPSFQDRMQAFARLHGAMAELPGRHRTVLHLRYFEGLSNERIAQIIQARPGTVRSLVHRGLGRLRKILERGGATRELDLHQESWMGGTDDEARE